MSVRRPISAADNFEQAARSGFTLLETLVALAILGVMVGVLVRVHLQTLRADDFSRLRGKAVWEAETILTGSLLGGEPQSLMDEARKQGWRVSASDGAGHEAPGFMEWRVSDSNPSAPVVVMMLRKSETSGQTNSHKRDQ